MHFHASYSAVCTILVHLLPVPLLPPSLSPCLSSLCRPRAPSDALLLQMILKLSLFIPFSLSCHFGNHVTPYLCSVSALTRLPWVFTPPPLQSHRLHIQNIPWTLSNKRTAVQKGAGRATSCMDREIYADCAARPGLQSPGLLGAFLWLRKSFPHHETRGFVSCTKRTHPHDVVQINSLLCDQPIFWPYTLRPNES